MTRRERKAIENLILDIVLKYTGGDRRLVKENTDAIKDDLRERITTQDWVETWYDKKI